MSNKSGKVSLQDFMDRFNTNFKAMKYFERRRWGNKRKCPYCNSINTSRSAHPKMPYRCNECRKFFSVKVGSIMESSKLSYKKWLIALYLVTTNLKGVSSNKLARDLGIAQKNAWFLLHRIRKAFEEQQDAIFSSPIEVDETYFGGKMKNMHNSKKPKRPMAGAVGKSAVVGIKSRKDNQIKAQVTAPVSSVTLQNLVTSTVTEGSEVYTDQNSGYIGLRRKNYKHSSVNHSVGEYVKEQAYTNGIESFWAKLKRGYIGVYHRLSKKHLQRYIDEYAGKHNIRPLDTLDQIGCIIEAGVGKRLKFNDLIAGERGIAT